MSERYTRLFSLPGNLYLAGSPVILAGGALLKDNLTGRVLAQLKMRSLSDKVIHAVKVRLDLFDTALCPIGEPVLFDYLDLSAPRDGEFGQKTPIFLPETKARSYTAAITEVIFADKTVWKADAWVWEPLPRQCTLEKVFLDSELVKQYKIAVGSNFSYYPMAEKDLWFCACGGVNRQEEPCHICNRTLPELQAIDREQLTRDKDARLAEEAAAAEAKAAAIRAAAEAAKKKAVQAVKIAIPIIGAVAAVILLFNTVILPNRKYKDALALLDAEKYEDAIAAFSALDGYKDSEKQIQLAENKIAEIKQAEESEAAYNDAIRLLRQKQDQEAYEAFQSLGDYKDSLEYVNRFQEKLTHVQYTTPNKKYYNYTVDITYNDAGETETETKEYYQTGATGYIEEARYEYAYHDNGYVLNIAFNYPKTAKSKYSSTTLVGEKYIYDAEDRLIEFQSIQHSGVVTHSYYLWLDESGELISGEIGQVDITNRDNCLIYMMDSDGKTIQYWNEKYDEDGNLTGEKSNETTCQYDADGQIIKKITAGETTYYTYQDGKLITERADNTTIRYEYTDSGKTKKSVREKDGNILSTIEYTYSMIYVPNARETA